METLRLARNAMATRFELVLYGANAVALRAAGEEALDEIERLEAQLSLFRASSEISRVNARAASERVRVTPAVFSLLQHAQQLSEQTGGAFDVTVGPLMRCWGFHGGGGQVPEPDDLAAARACVGMSLVRLERDTFSVRFERRGVRIDLGAIGKGYAIDRAVELLREAGVESALIHGGTSTVYGLGHSPEGDFWEIEIPGPETMSARVADRLGAAPATRLAAGGLANQPGAAEPGNAPFATVALRDSSLSVSAVWGKFFQSDGKNFGHVIDPRSGQPADRAIMSAVVLPSATESDALSTALLTVGPEGHELIGGLRAGIKTLVVNEANGELEIHSQGIEVKAG